MEHIGVYRSTTVFHDRQLFGGQRFAQSVLEGTCRLVADGNTNLVLAYEIIEVLIFCLLAFAHLAFDDTRSPRLALSPLAVGLEVEDDTLVLPRLQVGRRIAAEVVIVPVLLSVSRWIKVVFAVFL